MIKNNIKIDNNEREREREQSQLESNLSNKTKNKLTHNNKNKIVVWALFDDAKSSYKNGIKQYFNKNNDDLKIEVHSVGINDVKFAESQYYFYHQIDLSITNFLLIKQLSALPKPDIILASPPCESWSGADCNGKITRSISSEGIWEVKNKRYYDERNKTCHPVKRRFFEQKERGRLVGECTIGGTITIIDYFKPKVWVIENPATSKIWEFQKNHWNFNNNAYINKTYYSAYDENFSLKPTIFKSNIKLDLKREHKKSNNEHMALGSYSARSSIPKELVKDIIEQSLEKINI